MQAKIVRGLARAACACTLALVTDGCGDSHSQRPGQPLSVDAVVEHPEKFGGPIGVVGRVANVEPASGAFALGCEDACVAMPVKFSGTMPKAGSDVIVRGQIKKESDGRYIFNAESVTAKK
ncbi:MAG: hypothetical protein PCFJNLEI_01144 [Verrucomicrobiae bacterium]|nr:hypothetical protein [Verrucomicrobiae bacterium]